MPPADFLPCFPSCVLQVPQRTDAMLGGSLPGGLWEHESHTACATANEEAEKRGRLAD